MAGCIISIMPTYSCARALTYLFTYLLSWFCAYKTGNIPFPTYAFAGKNRWREKVGVWDDSWETEEDASPCMCVWVADTRRTQMDIQTRKLRQTDRQTNTKLVLDRNKRPCCCSLQDYLRYCLRAIPSQSNRQTISRMLSLLLLLMLLPMHLLSSFSCNILYMPI